MRRTHLLSGSGQQSRSNDVEQDLLVVFPVIAIHAFT